jgi:Tol biopolymer transport system component
MDIATHTVKSYGVSGLFPRYSPDGTQIAYLASGQSGSLQLFVMNADGSNSRQLTAAQVSYQDLSGVDWSPDGKWLLASTYNGLELVRVSDGQRLPLRVPGFQAAFKP